MSALTAQLVLQKLDTVEAAIRRGLQEGKLDDPYMGQKEALVSGIFFFHKLTQH